MERARRGEEIKVCGQHACRAVFRNRPQDILRVFVRDDRVADFSDLLHALAQQRRPYKVVLNEELERLTESTHHEGVCLVVRNRPAPSLPSLLQGSQPQVLVAITDVANPHNVGAILRTAAHFGARGVLLSPKARLSPAALRTAQGGAEGVATVVVEGWPEALEACQRANHLLVATSSHAKQSLFQTRLPKRAVILVGSEATGLPEEVARLADLNLMVPGTGQVESLNVSAATAVVLAELWRQSQGASSG